MAAAAVAPSQPGGPPQDFLWREAAALQLSLPQALLKECSLFGAKAVNVPQLSVWYDE